jgi:hypothetical protein
MKRPVANIISVALEIMMWLTLVAGVISGISIAKESNFNIVAGGIAGVIVGLIVNTYLWGAISVFVDIRNYLREISEME